MTQKELLYIEDAIGHERCMSHYLESVIPLLKDKKLETFLDKQWKLHKDMEKNLCKLLEGECHD